MSLSLVPTLFLLAAVSTPSASASTPIPDAFQGRWDLKSVACSNIESLGAVEIGKNRLDYWEATDEIISVEAERSDIIRLKVRSYDSNSDDPETARLVSLRLKLVDGGKHLKYQEKGKPSMTFARCMRATLTP